MCKAFPPCTNFRNKTAKYSAVQNSYLAARLSNDAKFWSVAAKFHSLQLWYSTEL
jgi:hypothetical protein